MDFGGGDEVDDDPGSVERAKDPGQEAVGDGLSVGVDVEHDDAVLDGHSGRHPSFLLGPFLLHKRLLRSLGRMLGDPPGERLVRVDDRPAPLRVFDVFDPDRYSRPDDLFHGERVDDLGPVVSQLGGLVGRDDGDESRAGDFTRIGGEDSVDFLPHLKFLCLHAHRTQRRAQVGVPTSDLRQQGSRDGSEESWL